MQAKELYAIAKKVQAEELKPSVEKAQQYFVQPILGLCQQAAVKGKYSIHKDYQVDKNTKHYLLLALKELHKAGYGAKVVSETSQLSSALSDVSFNITIEVSWDVEELNG